MTLNIPLTAEDLDDVKFALQCVWTEVSPDAGPCTPLEKAELVLDRIDGRMSLEVDKLCATYGYDAVLHMTAKTLFGAK